MLDLTTVDSAPRTHLTTVAEAEKNAPRTANMPDAAPQLTLPAQGEQFASYESRFLAQLNRSNMMVLQPQLIHDQVLSNTYCRL